LDLIIVAEPPPAALAGFIPIQPVQGCRHGPVSVSSPEPCDRVLEMPRSWPVSIAAVRGETLASLAWPIAFAAASPDACTVSAAQPFPGRIITVAGTVTCAPVHLPAVELEAVHQLPVLVDLSKEDPPPAGPLALQVPTANMEPRAETAVHPMQNMGRVGLPPVLAGIPGALAVETAGPAFGLPAQAVESFLPPPAEARVAPFATIAAALPRWQLAAAEWVVAAGLAEAVAGPAAEMVESLLPPSPVSCAVPPSIPVLRLPLWALAAEEPAFFRELDASVTVAPPAEHWMPCPPAGEVVREVVPSVAGARLLQPAIQAPDMASFAMARPMMRWAGGWVPAERPEAVCSYVSPLVQGPLPAACAESSIPCLPDVRCLDARSGAPRGPRAANLAAPAGEDYPKAGEPPRTAQPLVVETPEAGARRPQSLLFPGFGVEPDGANLPAEFKPAEPPARAPRDMAPQAGSAMPPSAPVIAVPVPVGPADAARFGLPQKGPLPMEFFCQWALMTPVRCLQWIARRPAIHPPKLVVRPVFERIEEVETPPKQPRRPPAFAEIFAIRAAARRRGGRNSLVSAGKVAAAGLLVGIGMWFGAGSVKIGRQIAAIHTIFPGADGAGGDRMPPNAAPGFGPVRSAPELPAVQGAIAQVRHAIQGRAAVELTDTFRRMEAWGASAKALPAGWSRHPDGYVRTGQLALYHPSQTFADYRFEFFGEIEKKSMSWVVRARDAQNYYAMKFTVVEPGLRPMIAAVHYPVVRGKKGRRVETPLAVMVHNHEPYHVEVEVKGNRVVTSIEGQEVDSWTDDALKVGGVGFFSEAGESARLYWIRVTKNQDWLGRVCAYLSGGPDSNIAESRPGEMPAVPPPAPPSAVDVTLAAAETEEFSHQGPSRARTLKYGRTELCRS